MSSEFKDVVDFHQHLCLDIAIGYRAAKALVREMGDRMENMKEVVAYVGNETCALDAIQEVTGCTFGKRNLYLSHTGKAVYTLQNTSTGEGVRAYCTYWEHFDHAPFRSLRKAAKQKDATPEVKDRLRKMTEETIDQILSAPESELFAIRRVTLPKPPKTGKYDAEPCGQCGEYVDVGRLKAVSGEQWCQECLVSNPV